MFQSDNNSGFSRIRIIISAVLIFMAAILIFFNTGQLKRSPFDDEILLDEPDTAVQNAEGITAVLDSAGSRLLILSSDDSIIKIVSYSSTSKNTPRAASDVVMTDENIFVLDHSLGANGTTIEGDRVLVYDLEGNYESTLMDSDEISSDKHLWRIYMLAADRGHVYGTFHDENSPDALVVADITNGSMNIIHNFRNLSTHAFDAFYSPSEDFTAAVADNGTVSAWEGEKLTVRNENTGKIFPDDIRMNSDNELIVLDQNGNAIMKYDNEKKSGSRIVTTSAVNFSICADTIIYADPVDYTLNRMNIVSGEKNSAEGFVLSARQRVLGYLTWIAAIFGVLASGYLCLAVLLPWLKKKKSEPGKPKTNLMTTGKLYGPLFITFIFIFVISAFVFGRFYYNEQIDNRQTNMMNAGYSLRELSGTIGMGDALESIEGQSDYDSENHRLVIEDTDKLLMSGLDVEGSLNLPYQIYRLIDDTGDIMMVSDVSGEQRIGLILNEKEQKTTGLYDLAKAARSGEVVGQVLTYDNGTVLYKICEPVYDGEGNVAGMAVPIMSLSLASSQIMDELTEQIVTLFTLLAGVLVLFAEMNYFLKVCRLKRSRRRRGIIKKTVVEIDRTLNILSHLPSSVFLVFCVLITSEILNDKGIDNAMMLALPLTMDAVFYAIVRSFAGPLVKYNPRHFLITGIAGTAFSLLLMSCAIVSGNYVLMVGCAIVFGGSDALSYSSARSIQLSGIKPDPRFSSMLFTRLENPIAGAIGTAIGAVLRSIWGDIALIIYMLAVLAALLIIVLNFVHDDIAAVKPEAKEKKKRREKSPKNHRLKDIFCFYMKPNVVCMLVAGMMPVYILHAVPSYVLPLFNQYSGLSDVYIGLITFIIKMVAILLIPKMLIYISSGKHSESFWIMVLMAVLACTFGFFGAVSSMKTMVVVLLFITITVTSIEVMGAKLNMKEAEASGLNPNDTGVGFEMVSTGFSSMKNIILAFMLAQGYSFFGWIWCAICAGGSIIGAVTVYMNKRGKRA